MNNIFFLISIFITNSVIGQNAYAQIDDEFEKDSLKRVIFQHKDTLRRLQYECFSENHYYTKDSIGNGNDSLIIDYRSKSGQLLKKHIKIRRDISKWFVYEAINYYNSFEKPEFVEQWELSSSIIDTIRITRRIYSCDRFIYDSKGRLVRRMQFSPDYVSRHKIARWDYSYDLNGQQTSVRILIPKERFWD